MYGVVVKERVGGKPGLHLRGSRFCHVRSLNCVLTSSLKWSNAEGPVPGVVSYCARCRVLDMRTA